MGKRKPRYSHVGAALFFGIIGGCTIIYWVDIFTSIFPDFLNWAGNLGLEYKMTATEYAVTFCLALIFSAVLLAGGKKVWSTWVK